MFRIGTKLSNLCKRYCIAACQSHKNELFGPVTALTSARHYAASYGRYTEGDKVETVACYGLEEVTAFAKLSKDGNPLHTDVEFAKNTMFGRPIVHGVLVLG